MNWIVYPLIAIVTFLLMEGITWCTHKFVMHGFLWWLHEDHHNPTNQHTFEKNDAFFLIFAIPAWLCIMLGWQHETWWIVSIGAGITMYGASYFLVHDVIIHQRFKWFSKSNNRYIKTIRWAHKMHHKHKGKHDGESFGLLYAAKKYWDKIKRDEAMQKKNIMNPTA